MALLSPLIRRQRTAMVKPFIRGDVLEIGCHDATRPDRPAISQRGDAQDAAPFIAMLDRLLAAGKASIAAGHQRMLRDKVNVAAWYTDFIESLNA